MAKGMGELEPKQDLYCWKIVHQQQIVNCNTAKVRKVVHNCLAILYLINFKISVSLKSTGMSLFRLKEDISQRNF